MTVNPSAENTGIVFRRVDLEGAPAVPALCEYVTDTSRGTTIEKGEAKVSTIEHIVSALWTMGVDNALIDIDGPEAPIMDGSSREYVQQIEQVGIVRQKADRKYYEVTEKQVYTIPDKGVAYWLPITFELKSICTDAENSSFGYIANITPFSGIAKTCFSVTS